MSNSRLSFGSYQFSPQTGDLWKHGYRIKLQPKPQQVLAALLQAQGETVSRDDLHRRLWADSFVDFDQGLNVAVKKLRDALGDSAEEPRYIETVPGLGYRWLTEVQTVENDNGNGTPVSVVFGEARQPCTPNAAESASSPPAALPCEATPAEILGKARRALTLWSLASATTVLVLFTGLLLWKRSHPASHTSSPGWVLIADFENRTGEPVLDGTLEYALERELSNSQFVRVVPRQRAEDAVRLMRKPVDSRLDASLSREVCLRDGEIPAFVSGRTEKIGGTYVLSAELHDASTGVIEASFTEQESQQSQLAPAVRRISNQVRERLGERPEIVRASNDKLEKVTTPSLRALQLYSRADRVIARGGASNRQAIALLEEAIKEDPDFASAHNLLGWAYYNNGDDEKAELRFTRAYQLAESTPDREKLFIQASYYEMALGDSAKADEAYQTLLRLHPDHYWANNNAGDEAAVLNAAKLRPNDFHQNLIAALRLLNDAVFSDHAQRHGLFLDPVELAPAAYYSEHAQKLIAAVPADASNAADFDAYLVTQHWMTGDIQAAHDDLLRMELRRQTEPSSVYFMTFGQLREAQRRIETGEEGRTDVSRAVLAMLRGDHMTAKRLVRNWQHWHSRWDIAGMAQLRLGLVREAEELHARQSTAKKSRAKFMIELTTAGLKMEHGHAEGAAELERYLPEYDGSTAACLGYQFLADAYVKRGDLKSAARVLEQEAPVRGGFGPALALREQVQLQLADVYREMGRTADAEKVEADLRKELMFADPDHPILLALRHRPERLAADTSK